MATSTAFTHIFEPARASTTRLQWLTPILVLAAFAATALVVPTMANVAVTDDWVYYRTVETLLLQHQLHIHDMSSAALVFQAVWGWLFALAFGLSFGVLRVSTLVMVGAGSVAVYGLARELGASRVWSALGMLAYLFHPLVLAIAFSFMTDPHFTSLLVISLWLYVRGLGRADDSGALVVAGSAVAAAAVLVRQQGVLIPVGVVACLLVQRRLTVSRRGVLLLVETSAIPAVTFVVYSAWLRFVNGVPWALDLFSGDLSAAGGSGIAQLVPRLAVITAVYIGLFVMPLALAAIPVIPCLVRGARGRAAVVAAAWAGLAVVGSLIFSQRGVSMPYVGQFVTATGLGPEDVVAARPQLLDPAARGALTFACVAASVVWGLAVARAPGGSAHGLVVGTTLAQAVGLLPASVHFAVWGGTLDRYLLPLVPLSIVLLVAALAHRQVWTWLAIAGLLVMAAISIAGTRDHLEFLRTTWSLAEEANQELGVLDTQLDAGAGWDGLHLYERPPDPTQPVRTPHPSWWIELWAPATDSTYLVAGARVPGYVVLREREYWSWLRRETLTMYLMRREGAPPS